MSIVHEVGCADQPPRCVVECGIGHFNVPAVNLGRGRPEVRPPEEAEGAAGRRKGEALREAAAVQGLRQWTLGYSEKNKIENSYWESIFLMYYIILNNFYFGHFLIWTLFAYQNRH